LAISLNSNKLTSREVALCSFKEHVNVPEMTKTTNNQDKVLQLSKSFNKLRNPRQKKSSNTIHTRTRSLMGLKRKEKDSKV